MSRSGLDGVAAPVFNNCMRVFAYSKGYYWVVVISPLVLNPTRYAYRARSFHAPGHSTGD